MNSESKKSLIPDKTKTIILFLKMDLIKTVNLWRKWKLLCICDQALYYQRCQKSQIVIGWHQ